jgi:hypothetical protein
MEEYKLIYARKANCGTRAASFSFYEDYEYQNILEGARHINSRFPVTILLMTARKNRH